MSGVCSHAPPVVAKDEDERFEAPAAEGVHVRQEPGVERLRRKDLAFQIRGGGRGNEMNSRPVRLRQKAPLRSHEHKFKVLAVLCFGSEGNTEVVPSSTVSLGAASLQSPALRVRACARSCRAFSGEKVWPNPSVKRSAVGRPPSPRAAVVYPASRGLGVLPPSPAYLER